MINRMVLQGRMVRDPELRRTGSGKAVTTLTVAWSEKIGESERKLFLDCVAWNRTAENAARYLSKGQELLVEGQLTQREYQDKDGKARKTLELQVDRLHFCGPKQAQQAPAPAAERQPPRQGARSAKPQQPQYGGGYDRYFPMDDADVPF